jgi:hypothetical protein
LELLKANSVRRRIIAMAERAEQGPVVPLNEIVDLLGALRTANLATVLGDEAGARADCDTRCTCNTLDCNCRGAVSRKIIDELSLSYTEVELLRNQRIADLRRQLEAMERPHSQ